MSFYDERKRKEVQFKTTTKQWCQVIGYCGRDNGSIVPDPSNKWVLESNN